MPWMVFGIIFSYLIGSIPTAYIFGRLLKGIDIRKFGSGNVGATNALRVLGKPVGITVLILDILKGLLVVVFLTNLLIKKFNLIADEALPLLLGLSCIAGHNWTVFLRFKGGKGVATTFGVLMGLAIMNTNLRIIFGLLILTWLLIFTLTRIVSVASVLAAAALPIYMIVFKQSRTLLYGSIIISVLIVLRHRTNLKRLLQKKEPPI